MSALIVSPLPGAGLRVWLAAWARRLISRRTLLRLAGVKSVMLEGRVYPLRPVPLGIARDLVPAIMRCSQRFAAGQIDESLYDDLVRVLALGLRADPRVIESLTVPLWYLAPVIDGIASVNALPVMEAGAPTGKPPAAMTPSTGTNSTPASPAPPDGPGTTSTVT